MVITRGWRTTIIIIILQYVKLQASIPQLVPWPRNKECFGRNGIRHKNALWCTAAGLILALICVAAAGQLVVL